ncbi:MAG: GNAT family N-acetyltransferase [Rhodobacterales bacterium]|jgi:GNAT superfamily N-acetyltransferase
MTPVQAVVPYDWTAILTLIQTEFADMDARIDPPSSMHLLTVDSIRDHAATGEVWVVEQQNAPIGCVFLSAKPDALYVGKLAVSARHRNQGLARVLIDQAEARALALGVTFLELQTRIELTENHAAFTRMGFVKTAESAHDGYNRPTSITMRRQVGRQHLLEP